MAGEWIRLEEHRLYAGVTVEAVGAQFKAEVGEAIEHGYLPENLAWSGNGGWHVLDVTFLYDPKRAARPV